MNLGGGGGGKLWGISKEDILKTVRCRRWTDGEIAKLELIYVSEHQEFACNFSGIPIREA